MNNIRTLTAVIITSIFVSMQLWYFSKFIGLNNFITIPAGYEFKDIMGRYPTPIEKPKFADFKTKVLQNNLEQASNDRLPAFTLIVKGYRDLARHTHHLSLRLLPASWSPVLPVGNEIISTRDRARLMTVGIPHTPTNRSILIEKADFYNSIAKEHPSCRVFVIPVISAGNWLSESHSHFKGKTEVLAGEKYFTQLESLLDPRVHLHWIGKGLSLEARLRMYYKTDHHFTMRGGYIAYQQIIRTLATGDTNEMSHLPIAQWQTIPGVRYRGTLARKAGAYTQLADQFEVAIVHWPAFTILTPKKRRKTGIQQAYLDGQFPTEDFANHYGLYFGGDYGLIRYSSESAPRRNLLIVSDSYDDQIEPLLAKHYRNTFFLNPDRYKEETGKSFLLNDIISKHKIDDILFFGKPLLTLGFRGL